MTRTLFSLFILILAHLGLPAPLFGAVHDIPSSTLSREVCTRLSPQLDEELMEQGLHLGAPVFVRIFKQEGELELWLKKGQRFQLFKSYSICDYSGELGPKQQEGDRQSPEGFYSVGREQLNPWSKFHLAFNLGFPNEYDRAHQRTGSALMVHGRCSSVGCYAMTDFRMEEIYTLVEAALTEGQPRFSVHIFPFRMTWDNLATQAGSSWIPFWENLKQGYDAFELQHIPPLIMVEDKRYVIGTIQTRPTPVAQAPTARRPERYASLESQLQGSDTL